MSFLDDPFNDRSWSGGYGDVGFQGDTSDGFSSGVNNGGALSQVADNAAIIDPSATTLSGSENLNAGALFSLQEPQIRPELQNIYDSYKTPEDYIQQLGNINRTIATSTDPGTTDFFNNYRQNLIDAAGHYGLSAEDAQTQGQYYQYKDIYDTYKTPEEYLQQLGNLQLSIDNNKDPELSDWYNQSFQNYLNAAGNYGLSAEDAKTQAEYYKNKNIYDTYKTTQEYLDHYSQILRNINDAEDPSTSDFYTNYAKRLEGAAKHYGLSAEEVSQSLDRYHGEVPESEAQEIYGIFKTPELYLQRIGALNYWSDKADDPYDKNYFKKEAEKFLTLSGHYGLSREDALSGGMNAKASLIATEPERNYREKRQKIYDQIVGQNITDQWTTQRDGTVMMNALNMAGILTDIGITDINQFGEITKTDADGNVIKVYGNKLTGQEVPGGYGNGQFGGGRHVGYHVYFQPNGTPVFYTVGDTRNALARAFSDNPILGTIAQVGAAFFGGPAGSAALNIALGKEPQDVVKAAVLNYVGGQVASGVSGSEAVVAELGQTGANIAGNIANNFVRTGDLKESIITGGVGAGVDLLATEIPGFTEMPSVAQNAFKAAVRAELTGNDVTSAVVESAITSGLNAARDAATSDTGGIQNRITDEAVSNTSDPGVAAFIDAKRTGASDEEAMEAANSVTGVVVNAIPDSQPNTSVITNAATGAADPEFGDLAGAQADATARNTVTIGNAEANDPTEAAALAKVRDPSATSFTFGGNRYTMSASSSEMAQAVKDANLLEIQDTPNFSEAYARARSLLGAGQTFSWFNPATGQVEQKSTATAAERPDLNITSGDLAIQNLNAANLSTTTPTQQALIDAQTDPAARDAAAVETALLADQSALTKPMGSTSFLGQIYKDLNENLRLSGVAANEYLKNNPNSPITQSVSTAFEAAGNLQKNVGGGAALLLNNKPLSDAIVKGGDDLTRLGQSIGTGPQDTKNWNDTVGLIDKASGFEKVAIMAGRIMDGTSGLGRQVVIELRQELPGLFLGGGSVKGIMLATGAMDVAETAGNAALEAYDNDIKKGKPHAQAMSSARAAGGTAAMTEAAIQLTLGKLADFAAGKLDNILAKGATKVTGEGVVEGSQEAGSSVAVDLALGNAIDVNKALTQGVVGAAVGKGTAAATSPVDAAQTDGLNQVFSGATTVGSDAAGLGEIGNVAPGGDAVVSNASPLGGAGSSSEAQVTISVDDAQQRMADLGLNVSDDTAVNLATQIDNAAAGTSTGALTGASTDAITAGTAAADISNNVTTQIGSGADAATVVGSSVTAAVNAGGDVSTAVGSSVTAAVNAGGDVNAAVGSAITAAVNSGSNVSAAVESAVTAVVDSGGDVSVAVVSAVTSAVDAGKNVSAAIDSAITTAVAAGSDASAVVGSSVTAAVNAGGDVNTVVGSSVAAAINAGANVTVAVDSAVTAAANAGTSVDAAVASSVAAAVNNGADVNSAVTAAVDAAVNSGNDVTVSTDANTTTITNATTDTQTTVNTSTGVTTTVDNANNVTTTLDGNTTTVVDANTNTTSQTTVDSNANTQTTVIADANANTNTQTVVNNNTNTTTSTTVDTSNNTTTQTTINANTNTQTTVLTDTENNTQTTIKINTNTGDLITQKETPVPSDWSPPSIENPVVPSTSTPPTKTPPTDETPTGTTPTGTTPTGTTPTGTTPTGTTPTGTTPTGTTPTGTTPTSTPTTVNPPEVRLPAVLPSEVLPSEVLPPDVKPPTFPEIVPTILAEEPKTTKPKTNKSNTGAAEAFGMGAFGLPSGINVDPASLRSRVTEGAIDPLARVKAAQAELERDVMMNQMDPRFLNVIQQRMDPQQQAGQPESDVGALERLLGGEPDDSANEGKYYAYGSEDSIDSILGGKAANYKEGGFVEPLKASGGMVLPLLAKSGGALGHYQGRENFKEGKHVAGKGDGQSDDIPAWLADGEFVFPADVVSALGNGSTKAGTDKLYEMMHGIRDRARSKGPKDLPPAALKSPLDYLKSSKRSAK